MAVLADVRKWIPKIATNLSAHGEAIRYSPARFAWLLENASALSQAIEQGGGTSAGALLAIAEARARTERRALSSALGRITAGAPEAEAEVSAARGAAHKPKEILDSLRALVATGETWLAKTDAESIALCQSVYLAQADLDRGNEAADALAHAIRVKTEAGAERATDPPATNRVEGRVTYEMMVAKSAFDDAAGLGVGERLAPGPGTRGLFGSPSKKTPAATPTTTAAANGTAPKAAATNKPDVSVTK